jgi:hypothetical protein
LALLAIKNSHSSTPRNKIGLSTELNKIESKILMDGKMSEDSEEDEEESANVEEFRGTSELERNKMLSLLLEVPPSNILIVTGNRTDKDNAIVTRFLTGESWGPDGEIGPVCGLCDREVCSEGEFITTKLTRYLVFFENEISHEDREMGMLHCCYCLKFFHRHNCSLAMSDLSYINKLKSRDWACPICVPSFVLIATSFLSKDQDRDLNVSYKKILNDCYSKIQLSCNANIVLFVVCAYSFVFDTGWFRQENAC